MSAPAAGSSSTELGEFIVEHGRHVGVRVGEWLFHEGDRSLGVYAVVRGRVEVSVVLPSGRELVLGVKYAGQEFGELSSIDERPRSAAARAAEDGVVATMTGDDFLGALHDRGDLAIGVLRNLARQLRSANDRFSAHHGDSVAARVGGRLLELADLHRRHGGPGSVDLPITQGELANWVGSSRESTARVLATFRSAGAVTTGRGRITVVDVRTLREVARST